MQVRHWLRPPRLMLVVFVGVALVSSGALGWLGWLLLAQDAALDGQRRQEALDLAADRAAAAMQRSIGLFRCNGRPVQRSGAPLRVSSPGELDARRRVRIETFCQSQQTAECH